MLYKHKHHIIPIAIILLFMSLYGLTKTVKILAQTGTIPSTTIAPTTCAYTYSDWSACSTSGQQYRTITSKTPSGCSGGTAEALQKSCTYTAPTCTFTYSDWSACDSNGQQYRTVNSATPSGCTGTPEKSRSCTYVPPTSSTGTLNCSSNCSSWSVCGQDGYQIRTCTAPSGCPQTGWTEKNNCVNNTTSSTTDGSGATSTTSPTCNYQCSSWSNCYADGYQERTCQKPSGFSCIADREKRSCSYAGSSTDTTSSPTTASCSIQCSTWSICSPAGIKSQKCWPSAVGCPGETKTNTQTCAPTVCKFKYSGWTNCTEGMQFRTIFGTEPAGCVGGKAVLGQTCSAAGNTATATSNTPNAGTATSAPTAIDPEVSVNDDWKKQEFKTTSCQDQICGGAADPDNDGLSNNDEFRYGTDPKNRDTDQDGKTDGEEVSSGTDPLKSAAEGEADKMAFENPKETGTEKAKIYQVNNIEMVASSSADGSKRMKVSGKGPANSYVNVYIYSGDPVIITVKTDSNGDWTYTVDKELENGDHTAYVAVTNNSGAIKAKSAPLPFVKTAEAVSTARAAENNTVQPTTKSGLSLRNLLFVMAASLFGVMFALIVIGMVIKKVIDRSKQNNE